MDRICIVTAENELEVKSVPSWLEKHGTQLSHPETKHSGNKTMNLSSINNCSTILSNDDCEFQSWAQAVSLKSGHDTILIHLLLYVRTCRKCPPGLVLLGIVSYVLGGVITIGGTYFPAGYGMEMPDHTLHRHDAYF